MQLCDDGRVVLLDFGLAAPHHRAGGALEGWIVGSLPYIAPEILTDGEYSPASDLYALGMTLHASVSGRALSAPTFDIMTGRVTAAPAPELTHEARALTPVIGGLLDHDPARRISLPTAERMLAMLAAPDFEVLGA